MARGLLPFFKIPSMKKLPPSPGSGIAPVGIHTAISSAAHATVNQILKAAYRRHARGRVARAAMDACLGR